MKIHLTMSVLVIILGLVLSIDQTEWMLIALAIGGVLSAELMNSAVEKAVDLYTRDFHPLAKMAKDMAAGAVLVISVAAMVIGLLIFIPKLFVLFS
ncbi:diacylglycerol kinase family protein [Mesobacillus foraminis]|nr:diacylglycerol kinase family protein [Mesobacillus foraminis]